MELKEYQKRAEETCMETSKNVPYMIFNLVGEVGELAGKIGKQIRKGNCYFESTDLNRNFLVNAGVEEKELELWKKEAGDVLWQLSGFCSVMGWDLEDIAEMNLEKLSARKQAGTIDGNGDGVIRSK